MQTRLSNRIEQAMTRLEGGDPDRTKSTLLIVDDEKGPRESLRMILSPQHRVLVAHDGAQALAMLAEHEVDAVTIDLNMPGMKGDALMRRIRKEHPQVEVVVITGYSSVESAVDGLRHGIFDYLSKPFDVVQVSNTVRRALSRRESRLRLVAFLRGIGEVLGHDRDPNKAIDELADSADLRARLRAAIEMPGGSSREAPDAAAPGPDAEILDGLAAAVESREPHRAGHARRVAFLAGMIGERIGLSPDRREELRVASLLHDLGRIAVPSRADDDSNQSDGIGMHAGAGADLVRPLGYSATVADAIRHHHERWDGGGAPDRLRGSEIPVAARIIAVADAFDRLTHDEPGREACSPARAIVALRGQSGRELDPDLLKALIALAEAGASSSGPLLGMHFESGDDPVETIASATAWLENDR